MQLTNAYSNKKTRAADIAETLRNDIAERCMPADTPIMSTREIAGHFNVSPLTADRAVRILVDAGVLYRTKGSGTFVKSSSPKITPKSKPLRLAIVGTDNYRLEGTRAYNERTATTLKESGSDFLILPFEMISSHEKAEKSLSSVDGALLSGACLDPVTTKIFTAWSKPVVLYRNNFIVDVPFHQVVLDFYPAMIKIIDRIKHDDRAIVVFCETHRNGTFIRDKFLDMLREARGEKVPVTVHMMRYDPGCEIINYRFFCSIAKELKGKMLFSTSDYVSNILLNALDDNGMRPLIDYDLVSSDNLEANFFRPYPEPRMTTINCPRGICAEEAAKLLVDMTRTPSACQHIVRVPTDLIIRQTGFTE